MSKLHLLSGTEDSNREVDVVFIHGLGGHYLNTWTYKPRKSLFGFSRDSADQPFFWPEWLGKHLNEMGHNAAVWSLDYAASPSKWQRIFGRHRDSGYGMGLIERGQEALHTLSRKGIGERPLLLICHSLGGLVAKQLLRISAESPEDRFSRLAQQTRALLFLATPHAGSDLATWMDQLRKLLRTNEILLNLKADDSYLGNLYYWYQQYSTRQKVATSAYYEDRPFKGLLVVRASSANPGIGSQPCALDENHLSIAKPKNQEELVCQESLHLLSTFLTANDSERVAKRTTIQGLIWRLDRKYQEEQLRTAVLLHGRNKARRALVFFLEGCRTEGPQYFVERLCTDLQIPAEFERLFGGYGHEDSSAFLQEQTRLPFAELSLDWPRYGEGSIQRRGKLLQLGLARALCGNDQATPAQIAAQVTGLRLVRLEIAVEEWSKGEEVLRSWLSWLETLPDLPGALWICVALIVPPREGLSLSLSTDHPFLQQKLTSEPVEEYPFDLGYAKIHAVLLSRLQTISRNDCLEWARQEVGKNWSLDDDQIEMLTREIHKLYELEGAPVYLPLNRLTTGLEAALTKILNQK